MYSETSLEQLFEPVRGPNEAIYWTGRPAFLPWVLSGLPLLIFGLLWGAFDYFAFIRNMTAAQAGFAVPFFAFHLFPFYGSILYMLYLMFSHRNAAYALTSERVVIRSGMFGIDYRSIPLASIISSGVSIGPVENAMRAGSIQIDAGRRSRKGNVRYEHVTGIGQPYEVFKQLQELAAKRKAATV